jgi:hypothetical protein
MNGSVTVSPDGILVEHLDFRDPQLAVCTPAGAPAAVAPLTLIGSDGYCVYDPKADDSIAPEAALRLACALALASLRESSVQLDVPAVHEALNTASLIRSADSERFDFHRMTLSYEW